MPLLVEASRLARVPRLEGALRAIVLLLVALLLLAAAGTPRAALAAAEPAPERVQELLQLLADPEVQGWLEAQRAAASSSARAAAPAAQPAEERASLEARVDGALAGLRARLEGIVRAVPMVPGELARIAAVLGEELEQRGLVSILVLVIGFVALGFGAEAIYWRLSAPLRAHILASRLETPAERLAAVGKRLGFGLLWVGSFALGSIGAFLLFSWPPRLYHLVLAYLVAFLSIRLAIVAARFFLAPGAARFRIVPMSDDAAAYWARWSVLLVGWYVLGRASAGQLASFGVAEEVRAFVVTLLALVWLGLGLAAIWRRPPRHAPGAPPSRALSWALSAYLGLLWLFVLAGAAKAFWIGAVLALVPFLLRLVDQSVAMLLQPAEGVEASARVPSLAAVCLERGLRALVMAGGILVVAHTLGLDLGTIAARETLATRLLAGALKAAVILLVADLLWHLLKAWIDQKLAEAQTDSPAGSEEARRHARIRTLLPIARNLAMVTVGAIAIMMALASLGIEIGPLIAGAGVVGVAIGFGSQTLVRDIVSGAFYLMDDAFRVGEYIQAGNFKGTVESFSLRSIKLRHHRGPLFTVPFGELGAIQNLSRDWVIDKMTVSVTYDTDLDKVKKIIKQIGKELLEIEEFKPNIIETLKMQGVDQFGDFAIQIRMKMKTKPGEQFTIRRRAYALIKKAFEANGIKFAFPTVQVAGGAAGEGAAPAIAKEALDLVRPKEQAA
ncbi:MAG: mechanosensitive ion channel family protein [Geminicoccaceae bacterium]|nr:mechanosensitive ion channel family protein [Geminicoccaceae bacterium]